MSVLLFWPLSSQCFGAPPSSVALVSLHLKMPDLTGPMSVFSHLSQCFLLFRFVLFFVTAVNKSPNAVYNFPYSIFCLASTSNNISFYCTAKPLYAFTVFSPTSLWLCIFFIVFPGWWFPLFFSFPFYAHQICISETVQPSYLSQISTNIAPFLSQLKEEIKCNVCLEGQRVCINNVR